MHRGPRARTVAFTLSGMRGLAQDRILLLKTLAAVLKINCRKARTEGRRTFGGCCNTTGETRKHLRNIWKDLPQTHKAPSSCGGYWVRESILRDVCLPCSL